MKTCTRIVIALLTVLAASSVLAADLGISPTVVTMSVPTGKSGSTTVVGKVNNPPPSPYEVSLQLRPVGGSMPFPWLTTKPGSITNNTAQLLLPLTVNVPASAAPGVYTAFVQPLVMSSSIPLSPTPRPLQLSVTVTSSCSVAPTVALASPQPAEFKAPNGRLADVALSGNIALPAGCTLARAWYTLTDEYGVLGETKDLVTAADGSFGFAVPVQVSRRGDDKDGRLYQITVYAADEAGTGASAPAAVVVRHDQRKDK